MGRAQADRRALLEEMLHERWGLSREYSLRPALLSLSPPSLPFPIRVPLP